MKRLLTTAATALVLGSAAYADNHGAMSGYTYNAETDFYASDLIGMDVYRSDRDMAPQTEINAEAVGDWDNIGEINDLIVSNDGEVQFAIVGVGGFLGIGEKSVAVKMDNIKVLHEKGEGDGRYLLVALSQEQLEDAPSFEREGDMMNGADTEGNMDTDTEGDMDNAEMNSDQNASDMSDEEMAQADTETEQSSENMGDEAEQSMQATDDTEAATTRPLLARPNVQREGYAEVTEVDELTSDALVGQAVYGENDDSVGEIGNLLLDDAGNVDRAVINVGGFLGLGEKPIAVTFDELQILRDGGGDLRVYIDSTEDQLEEQPEYEG
ncbi:PRC-barrel domain-containing protein [Roseovarius sp. E0-M6]|uniref:PRC-barrel domain-containing protein n=1 Tax=Roseovarius sp. E0-M6 TaxID=3127118 RepID=UPI0030105F9E